MKNQVLLIAFLVIGLFTRAQVAVNDDGSQPNSHAMLDVDASSNDKGVLIPRLTTSQRTAMTLTANEDGLTVYDETTKSFWYWNITQWQELERSGTGWKLAGNAGTTSGTHFIGTTDSQALDLRTDNVIRARITTKGQIEILNTGQSVFVGEGAGANDDLTDNRNVFIGHQSGNSNTTGYRNTASGCGSLYFNTTGCRNMASGTYSLYFNTEGYCNTASGYQSLFFNTEGYCNTASGHESLFSNTAGYNNTANGTFSLYSNTTGYRNTASGYESLYSNTEGRSNMANGYLSLYSNTTGNGNTASGTYSLYSNTEGKYNTAMGENALYSNTTGYRNTAIGLSALYSNTTGKWNTAAGNRAMYSNTSGHSNVAIGTDALYNNTDRNNLVAIGDSALYNNGSGASNSYEAKSNTAVGSKALFENTTGYHNTALGFDAFSSGSNHTNSTALGYGADITASDQIRLGNSSVTSIGGYADWTNVSDKRFKKDVQENVKGLAFILKLRPVTYRLDMDAIASFHNTPDSLRLFDSERKKEAMLQTGFIAQDVEAAARSIGYEFSGVDAPKNEHDYYGLRYASFVVPLVKAVQEQQEMIDGQKQMIEQQQQTIKQLEQKLSEEDQLKAEIEQIKKMINKK